MPVDITEIARNNRIEIKKNGTIEMLKPGENAVSDYNFTKECWNIIYDDTIESTEIKRFVIAHELGHIFLGHSFVTVGFHSKTPVSIERAANQFAVRLLCPACVLCGLDVRTADEIVRLCGIPFEEAVKREKRMKDLRERDKFFTDPLESMVYKRFEDFIKNYK